MNPINKTLTLLCITSILMLNANEAITSNKVLSLNDLVQIALKNNHKIDSSKYKEEAKKANIDLSKVGYLPTLNLTGELAAYDIKTKTSNTNDPVNSVTLNASQLLYDFGKTKASVDSSKQTYDASISETDALKNSILLSVKQSYYNILNQHQLILVAKESVKIDSLQLEQAQEYLNAGVRTRIDVTNAQLQLSTSKLDLVKATYKLKSAKTQLITILGVNINDSLSVEKEVDNIVDLVKYIKFKPLELNSLIDDGVKNRPETTMYQAKIKSQKSKIRNVKKEYLPDLDFDASYADKNSNNVSLESQQWTAGVYLKWTLFSGQSTKANIKNNIAVLQDVRSQLKQQELTIMQEVTDAYFSLKENEESIKISSLNLELSIANLDLAQQRYKAGLNDLVEFNDAKLEYTKAKSNLVNTYYNYLISHANLEYASGVKHSF